MLSLDDVFDLYDRVGGALYGGELVSQNEHALQAAGLAEQAGEAEPVVIAALLHDFGHFFPPVSRNGDDLHHESGADALIDLFGPEVTEVVRLHVAAKRYLCAAEPGYWQALSDVSQLSLEKQGGRFSPDQARSFAALPAAAAAIRVRRYDDAAKIVGAPTPTLRHFRAIAARLVVQ